MGLSPDEQSAARVTVGFLRHSAHGATTAGKSEPGGSGQRSHGVRRGDACRLGVLQPSKPSRSIWDATFFLLHRKPRELFMQQTHHSISGIRLEMV